jgi:hypothetical protein
LITVALIVCLADHAEAQRRKPYNLPTYDNAPYHFGFTVGINQMNFTIKPSAEIRTRVFTGDEIPDLTVDSAMLLGVTSRPTFGFVVGIIGDKRLGRYFNVRFTPALTFGERYINYSIMGFDDGDESIIDLDKNVGSVFVDFPIVFKYKSKRLNNMRAFLLGGAKYSLDLASNAKKDQEKNKEVLKLKKNDVYGILGVGFDFYNNWFKFGVELKMEFGIYDILLREGTIYTDGISKLNSKVFQLCLTFE